MTAQTLRIAPGLALPADTVTSTTIIYGGKGMGKTNFAAVLCEELSSAELRFAFIDPVGQSWGLRHSSDGKGRGIEMLILGGLHGDIEITPDSGKIVADLVADENVSVLIDISRHKNGRMWGIAERTRFVADYCVHLYERQGERRRPLLQLIDEAGRFCPQEIRHDQVDISRCIGAVERMVEEGRNVGIGVCLITQRSARMNKSVSELADCMIAFRTVGPRSIAAILDWFGEHVEKTKWKALIEQLRTLPRGTALVVSPGWLQFEGTASIRKRSTFDSSATPESGKETKAGGRGAEINLDRYVARMAATIERAKADDPAHLKRQIAELTAKVKALEGRPAVAPPNTATDAALAEANKRIRDIVEAARIPRDWLATTEAELRTSLDHPRTGLARIREWFDGLIKIEPPKTSTTPALVVPNVIVNRNHNPPRITGLENGLSRGARIILTAIAQHPAGCSAEQIAVLTGYKATSLYEYLRQLSGGGYVTGEPYRATAEGISALGSDYEPLPTGDRLREYWLGKLGGGERKILEVVLSAYPDSLDAETLRVKSNYESTSVYEFTRKLLARKLLTEAGRGKVKASEELFG